MSFSTRLVAEQVLGNDGANVPVCCHNRVVIWHNGAHVSREHAKAIISYYGL